MLTAASIAQLIETAQAFAPHEMCGLLFDDGFHLTKNVAEDPRHAFKIDHEDYLKACMQHDGKPWALVHSHPEKAPAPSVKDCQLMDALELARQDMAMVIVGLQPIEIRVYRKQAHVYACVWAQSYVVPVG